MKITITDRAVKALTAPASGAVIYYDQQIAGFGVRLTANNVASFILNYVNAAGKERRLTMGRCAEMPALTARARALKLRQQVREGQDPQTETEQTAAAGDEKTVNDLADDYLEKYARRYKRPSSVENDEYMLKGIIRPRLGALAVGAIDKEAVERLYQELKATPTNANRVLSLLRKMFNLAVEWKWRADNPAKIPAKLRYTEDMNKDWLTTEELARLNTALDNYHNQDVADAIRLLMLTGTRQPEVLKAKWEEFDLDRGTWTKPSHHTKQKKLDVLPLNDAAMDLLRRMYAKHTGSYLFPAPPPLVANPGGHKWKHSPTRQGLLSQWRTISKAAGLAQRVEAKRPPKAKKSWRRHVKPLYTIHVLRHTFASQLVSKGETLPVIGKLLGHTQPSTTQRYAHVSDEALRAASNRFSSR